MILPVWNPQNPSVGDKVARAIVYFVALIYMFLGMSIIADRFMSSIEVCDLSSLPLNMVESEAKVSGVGEGLCSAIPPSYHQRAAEIPRYLSLTFWDVHLPRF